MKPALGRCWTFVPSVRLIFQPENEPCSFQPTEDCCKSFVRVTLDKSTKSGSRTTAFKITKYGLVNL